MTVRPSVAFKVFDETDSTFSTPLRTLVKPLEGDWLDVMDDYGSATLKVKNKLSDGAHGLVTNPDLAYLLPDRIVQVLVDNTPVFWWVIEEPDDDELNTGEENTEITTFAGRGPLALLDHAPVFPTLPFNLYPISQNRVLSCFSPEFDVSAWGTASNIVDSWAVTDPTLTLYAGKPSGFPTITNITHWIGTSTGTQFGDHIGHAFLVKDFTLTVPVYFKIFCAADNRARVYIDGMRILDIQTQQSTTDGFQKCSTYTIYLSAGTHRLGVHLVNTDFDGAEPPDGPGPVIAGNPMAFIADCWTVAAGSGQMLLRLFGSNTSWKIMEFPAQQPGFTVGHALNILLDQVQADGELTHITRSWTNLIDSNGNGWGTVPTFGLKVGDDLGATLKGWIAAGYCQARFNKTNQTLNLYRPGEMGSTKAVDYETGGLLLDLNSKKSTRTADCLLVNWAEGQTRVPTSGGTRMGTLAAGAAETLSEAQIVGSAFLADQSIVREQLTAATRIDTGAVPGVDYIPGDKVTVKGNLERVTKIAGRLDDTLGLVATPTFKDVILTWDERLAVLLKRMTQGTLSGQAPVATPIVPPMPKPQNVGANELTFQVHDPPTLGLLPDKQTSASTNAIAVKAYTKNVLPDDIFFQVLVNGVDILGGTGQIPSGTKEAIWPIVAGTGPDPAVQWIEGNGDRVTVNITYLAYLASGIVIDVWNVV